jgi:hypothetical protein
MKTFLSALMLAATLAAGHAVAATVSLSTSTPSVTIGAPVQVSLDIAGLNGGAAPGLGAFDFDILFDASLLSFQSASFGTGLDVFGLGDIQTVTPRTGAVNLFELALDTPADLIANQAGSFNLATLTFSALAGGTSSLTVGVNAVADAAGNALAVDTVGTSVTVSAVPEPESYALMLCGLAILGVIAQRRRRAHSQGAM